ncbi:MAG: hypothetical protein HW401_388 [Parcubacteria group bacterium]|nr:hypothetical protein [Parcubacteria group bacterium]
MNSAQRRNWRRGNEEEINELVKWMNSPDKYVSSGEKSNDSTLEMKKVDSHRTAFGKRFNKADWKSYLLRMGVVSEFSSGDVVTVRRIKLDVVI